MKSIYISATIILASMLLTEGALAGCGNNTSFTLNLKILNNLSGSSSGNYINVIWQGDSGDPDFDETKFNHMGSTGTHIAPAESTTFSYKYTACNNTEYTNTSTRQIKMSNSEGAEIPICELTVTATNNNYKVSGRVGMSTTVQKRSYTCLIEAGASTVDINFGESKVSHLIISNAKEPSMK